MILKVSSNDFNVEWHAEDGINKTRMNTVKKGKQKEQNIADFVKNVI